jgi:hypothetical protein
MIPAIYLHVEQNYSYMLVLLNFLSTVKRGELQVQGTKLYLFQFKQVWVPPPPKSYLAKLPFLNIEHKYINNHMNVMNITGHM